MSQNNLTHQKLVEEVGKNNIALTSYNIATTSLQTQQDNKEHGQKIDNCLQEQRIESNNFRKTSEEIKQDINNFRKISEEIVKLTDEISTISDNIKGRLIQEQNHFQQQKQSLQIPQQQSKINIQNLPSQKYIQSELIILKRRSAERQASLLPRVEVSQEKKQQIKLVQISNTSNMLKNLC